MPDHDANDEAFSTARQVLPECDQALFIVDFIILLNFEGGESLATGAFRQTSRGHRARSKVKA